MSDRLTKSEWLRHGLRTLADEGSNALKVGPMAAKLEVSRGSFYWHFRDIADFRSQLLRSWQERATEQVIEELEAEKTEPDRLKRLVQRAYAGKPRLDRAIRSWAAEDEEVAAVVASVDARRVAYVAELLAAAGVKGQRAPNRAAFLYWAYLGQALVVNPRHSWLGAPALDDISDLFVK